MLKAAFEIIVEKKEYLFQRRKCSIFHIIFKYFMLTCRSIVKEIDLITIIYIQCSLFLVLKAGCFNPLYAGIQNGSLEKSYLQQFEKCLFLALLLHKVQCWRQSGQSQAQVPHMWDLIFAPACLQFYKSTDTLVSRTELVKVHVHRCVSFYQASHFYQASW